ncbi:hypothetical protein LOZ57_001062 [Ophidiomyces ophidiicola]|uniref:uncharacterized protein n=1 Tax=Ophidiomyces ophidiicola TaxID=1387563 RepID=UPI0020C385E7|nr:uncharacterized protein LOZ57_001062 [Ophidiomyces ophidiicola]KAI1951651.1 hypothetical protein LOZ57_001062 [Ophidiomyces ophidiicola]
MSLSPQLAPPGSSTYSSDSLHVGDGTWDSQRNTFLLPNLMGLNFATMQYNGMGNRFRNFEGYHPLIRAHGVIAAITFLGLVPFSILLLRFYHGNPHLSLRLHIWMQILALFLTTVIFVTGWFAVGPKRSLTNPHHGIGLAIYVLVISQILWGWIVHRRPQKRRLYLPFKEMLHHWFGWITALLGIIQIPLGLTLYGSPISLFILYTLAVFGLFILFTVLTYFNGRYLAGVYNSRSSFSGPEVIDDGTSSRIHRGLAGTAGYAGRQRSGSRGRSPLRPEGNLFGINANEKRAEDRSSGTWKKRLLQIGGAVGAAAIIKKLVDKRRDRESDAESGRYHPAHTVTDTYDDDYSVSRVDEELPPPAAARHRYDPPASLPQSQYTESQSNFRSEKGHGLRNALFGAGALAAIRGLFKSRAARDEERRLEEIRQADLESERAMRERRYTGDGRLPRRHDRRYGSVSDITPTDADDPRSDLPPVPPHRHELSGSGTVTSLEHDQRPGPSAGAVAAGAAGVAAGAAVGGAAGGASNRRFNGPQEGSADSPPVSIKVKLHNNGRRVTLRQLTREEAEADREARRKDRTKQGRRRRESSLSGGEGDDHWRRVEELERRQAEDLQHADPTATAGPSTAPPPPLAVPPVPQTGPGPPVGSNLSVPAPPPPIPAARPLNSPLSNSTDLSGSFASRSGRRRAERRTQARQGGSRVEFT